MKVQQEKKRKKSKRKKKKEKKSILKNESAAYPVPKMGLKYVYVRTCVCVSAHVCVRMNGYPIECVLCL